MTNAILSTQQAADKLGVSVRRVQQMVRTGKLPAGVFGGSLMIQESDLALVSDRKPGRPPKPKAEAQPVGAAELKQPQQLVAGAAGQGTAVNGAAQAAAKPKRKAAKKKGAK